MAVNVLKAFFVEINVRIAYSDLSFDILALIGYNKYTVVLDCFNLFTVLITCE